MRYPHPRVNAAEADQNIQRTNFPIPVIQFHHVFTSRRMSLCLAEFMCHFKGMVMWGVAIYAKIYDVIRFTGYVTGRILERTRKRAREAAHIPIKAHVPARTVV